MSFRRRFLFPFTSLFSPESHAILIPSKIAYRHRGVAQAASFLYARKGYETAGRRSADVVIFVTA